MKIFGIARERFDKESKSWHFCQVKSTLYLKYLLENNYYRLVDLAKDSSVFVSDLSKIVNNKRALGRKSLGKILTAMREEHQSQLLLLWLEDQVPEGFENMVHVARMGRSNIADEDVPLKGTVEGDLRILKAAAEDNPAVAKLLTSIAALNIR